MINIFKKNQKPVIDTREEAMWIRENCSNKFSVEDIMEILDYEMGYLAHLGLVDMTKEEFESNLNYWAERNA